MRGGNCDTRCQSFKSWTGMSRFRHSDNVHSTFSNVDDKGICHRWCINPFPFDVLDLEAPVIGDLQELRLLAQLPNVNSDSQK